MNRIARLTLAAGVLAGVLLPAAQAQDATSSQTKLAKQLDRVDFSLSGIGLFNGTVSGTVPNNGTQYSGQTVTETGSNTAGLLATVRYTLKPYFGIEYNATYARYTETFNIAPYQVQSGVTEQSFGYVVTPRQQIFGLQPIISVGAGSTRFKPTKGGGQAVAVQWRATYYYNVGVQKEFGNSHFGARLSMRQAFFKAPDFLMNYLTINKRTSSFEPNLGIYVRF